MGGRLGAGVLLGLATVPFGGVVGGGGGGAVVVVVVDCWGGVAVGGAVRRLVLVVPMVGQDVDEGIAMVNPNHLTNGAQC